MRAVVLNSGGANCYTGPEGFQTTHATAERVAGHLGIGAGDVVVCSTGLIGLSQRARAPARRRRRRPRGAGRPRRRGRRARDHDHRLGAQADRRRGRRLEHRRHGQGRGHARAAAGHDARRPHHRRRRRRPPTSTPRCAPPPGSASTGSTPTAACPPTTPSRCWPAAPAASRRRCPTSPTPSPRPASTSRCSCSRDAEGSDHDIAITVVGAATEDDAVEVGRSIARSNLFKAAVFGKDPNWGRILASIGTTDAAFDPADLDVAVNGVWVCRHSTPADDPSLVDLAPREVSVTVDLKSGVERATVWTNDLTHAYVHENSAYSS